ncbi:transketolase C-terminal domain-containing protein [Candidatus Pelagibacter sp.]|nr:transketolase C-terminal domain-containing protein [Candidatus Pelagibacter sp.]
MKNKINLNSDVRDIFFSNVRKLFLKNKNNYILTNDADVFELKKIQKNKRFYNIGVAEQNLINIAAGLSKFRKLPIIFGFCSFITFRCYEQLRFNIGSHNLDVKIIGIGPGFSFPYDGPTHHGTEDLYLTYLIPEFEIFNISDNNLANLVSKKINQIKGPTYIRLDKGVLNYNLKIKYNLNKGYEYIKKQKKKSKLIITSGYFCKLALEATQNLDDTSVINIFRFKNFDKKSFVNDINKHTKIYVYDESSKNGGIFPIISQIENLKKDFQLITAPNKQIFLYYKTREEILKKLGLLSENLKKKLILKQ